MPRRKLEDIPVRPIPTDPSAMLTEIDVARMTGLSRQTLANWRSARINLPFSKIGDRRVGYVRRDVEAFLARGRVGVTVEGNTRA